MSNGILLKKPVVTILNTAPIAAFIPIANSSKTAIASVLNISFVYFAKIINIFIFLNTYLLHLCAPYLAAHFLGIFHSVVLSQIQL